MNNHRFITTFYSHWWLILGIFFSWYFYHLSPNFLISFASSSDFLRLSQTGGNLAVPQFALLLMTLKFVGFVLYALPPYQLGYLVSSMLGGLTMALLYGVFTHLETRFQLHNRGLTFLLKNACLFYLASNSSFLAQSIFFERYLPLVVFFLGAILLGFLYRNKSAKSVLLSLFVVSALGVSIHWLFLWMGVIALLFGNFKKALLVVLSLLAGLLLTFAATNKTAIEHSFLAPTSIPTLATTYMSTYLTDGFSLLPTYTPVKFTTLRALLADYIARQIGWGLFALSLVGLYRVWCYSKRMALQAVLFIAPFIAQFVLFSQTQSLDTKVFIELSAILPITFFTLLAFLGSYFILERLYLGLSILHSPQTAWIVITTTLGGFMIASTALSAYRFTLPEQPSSTAHRLLSEIPKDSLLVCFSAVNCSDLLYVQQIEKSRSDVTILPYYYNPQTYTLNTSTLRPFGYQNTPQALHEMISVALHNNTAVYAAGVSQEYYSYLGFDLGLIYYVPQGNYGQLVVMLPKTLSQAPVLGELESAVFTKNKGLLNDYALQLIQNRLLSATTYFQMGNYDYGYQEMNAASVAANTLDPADFTNFLANRNGVEQLVRSRHFVSSDPLAKVPILMREIPRLIENGLTRKAIAYARGALLLDPFNISLRHQISLYYRQMDLLEMALQEESIVKKLSQ